MATRTITLTGRPPVRIDAETWPIIAEASYHDFEGQHDFQSTRHWRGWVRVREHADGRRIVYAGCSFESSHRREGYRQRSGLLLTGGEDIVTAIRTVHGAIDMVDDAHRDAWRVLADECIADLPAEDL